MLDIIFISYDEPNADKNWKALKFKFPHAKRVHGVKGIANAHIEAAKKSNTLFFYVVDGDAEIHNLFDFKYKPTVFEAQYVHVWHAMNPATGIDYGYGGIKLFSKNFFKDVKNQLDFTTTLTKDIKIIDTVACVTRFNSDPIRAFRGAFRESVKLHSQLQKDIPEKQKQEARQRLDAWLNPLKDCAFREYVVSGAQAGIAEATGRSDQDLMFINDHDLMLSILMKLYPEIDLNTNPKPSESNPMKHEFFFTSRIASALYDPYVLENVPVTELRDAISDGQLLSKNWLIEVLSSLINDGSIEATKEKPARIAILGGWIGTLSLMINCFELPVKITSIDLDARANAVAEKLNYDFNFSTKNMNMYDVDYSEFDIIINTSSEHIPDIVEWRNKLPSGKIIIAQNNDFTEGSGHVSCVENSTEFRSKLKFLEVLYEGTRTFPQYSRFMLVGRT